MLIDFKIFRMVFILPGYCGPGYSERGYFGQELNLELSRRCVVPRAGGQERGHGHNIPNDGQYYYKKVLNSFSRTFSASHSPPPSTRIFHYCRRWCFKRLSSFSFGFSETKSQKDFSN